ncbi:hypothetical protein [Longimicrobium sp.]|uniref:hypothetical protein n=1 Tax=Longimicrobium sp. TaxID=2029185 RepID=UPI002BCED5FD|nr:hypothetical protein [Longimicrobium sp.]HSU15681.1 hypothetical protein [Longimicrobium sp.]
MKKFRLAVEELCVESFGTAAADPARGTVRAAEATPATGCALCGTAAVGGSCFNGCTIDNCEIG